MPVRLGKLKRSGVRERGHPNRQWQKIKEAQKFNEIEEDTKYYKNKKKQKLWKNQKEGCIHKRNGFNTKTESVEDNTCVQDQSNTVQYFANIINILVIRQHIKS